MGNKFLIYVGLCITEGNCRTVELFCSLMLRIATEHLISRNINNIVTKQMVNKQSISNSKNLLDPKDHVSHRITSFPTSFLEIFQGKIAEKKT